MKIDTPSRLSDAALDAAVKRLAACERDVTVELIVHLAELDTRRLYLGFGFSSLFTYCRTALALSEQAAYHRIVAARAMKRYPAIAAMLADGSLNLSSLRILAPHLTRENHVELLGASRGASKRAVEELVAARLPQDARPASIRRVPVRGPAIVSTARPTVGKGLAPVLAAPQAAAAAAPAKPAPPIAPPPPAGPAPVTPRAEDRYEFRFTGTKQLRDKLEAARDLLRHAVPSGDLAEVMDRALTALLEDLARTKFAATDKPRASHGTAPGSRTIPAAVERAVWSRDGGRCAFVAGSGRRCDATAFLEFHHVHPHGVGGPPTLENIALRCQAHNQYEAELFYGRRGYDGGAVSDRRASYGNSPRGESGFSVGTFVQ